jgi:hypothetical protein
VVNKAGVKYQVSGVRDTKKKGPRICDFGFWISDFGFICFSVFSASSAVNKTGVSYQVSSVRRKKQDSRIPGF